MLRLNITLHSSLCLAALLVPGLCPALQLSHNLPAAEVSSPPAVVRFLVFDSIDAALPIEVYNFPAGQYQLSPRADRVWISAQLGEELEPQFLWVELELDGSPKGERIPLATVTPGVTFAAGNNLDMDGNGITSLAQPSDPNDAATMGYVDGAIIKGNAATAAALAEDGPDCPAGQYARGVSESGAAQGCTNTLDTLDSLSCSNGQTAKSDGTGNWVCADDDTGGPDSDLLASLGCEAGDVARFNGTDWECSDAVTRLENFQIGKRVFLTADAYDGDFSGLDGADTHCNELAREISLPGSYRAWLSDNTGSPSTRFIQSATPYILVNGTVVADNWSDLTDGDIDHVINVNQYGIEVPAGASAGTAHVWSNTLEDGARNLALPEAHCSNWTSTATTGAMGVFSSTETPSELTGDTVGSQPVRLGWTRLQTEISEGVFGEAILSCASARRLYCFQQ